MSDDALERLTQAFERLGAREPKSWANSQATEGIPQLHRFMFLREAFKRCVWEEDDLEIIDRAMRATPSGHADPYADEGHVLRSLVEKGATSRELVDLVRCIQAQALFGLCYLLEGNMSGELEDEVQWGLFVLDEEDEPVAPIPSLHESVLEMDPTGRQMCPRK